MLERLRRRRCRQVALVLQSYLDGEVDAGTAGRVHDHLEECRRCGLEATTYRAIKDAIPMAAADSAQPAAPVDPDALHRLRTFADDLVTGEQGESR
jgi:anti-sigma factor RsiW